MHMLSHMHCTKAKVFPNTAFMVPPDQPIDLIGLIVYTISILPCQERIIEKHDF